ncbi:MAG: hypothetical protein L0220_05720 [Acidobacteria bacterium]|nr:hypothetical protein [Acidobacteriota bacterium]
MHNEQTYRPIAHEARSRRFFSGTAHTERRPRNDAQAFAAWEQATRQKWRALKLAIIAKLEAVESKIATFETEFVANIVMPDGRTVGEHAMPAIEQAYLTGKTPRLLLPGN